MSTFRRTWVLAMLAAVAWPGANSCDGADKVRDRLWVWGHPAGVYNASYLRPIQRLSTIEPVDGARSLGVKNMIFVRYDGKPAAPFDDYYRPFAQLDRVYWSLVAAGGATSQADRDAAFSLAEKHKNLVGFILDDFFHEPGTGNAADPLPSSRIWLAANSPQFPVRYQLTLPQPVACDAVELVQTDWPSGDYRAKTVAVEVSADGQQWRETAGGELPNRPQAVLRLSLAAPRVAGVRLRFLNTHDQRGAMSVGLGGLRLLASGRALDAAGWKASASSTYPGFDANAVIAAACEMPFRASLTPAELHTLRQRSAGGRKLPIMAVIYTRQVKPGARAHLAEVDQLCLWTWRPADLANLEANFAALEKLAPGKTLFLGCYMYDFDRCRPLPVAQMQRQVELGLGWLKTGRIAGMIFLATPNVDVGLEAVDWTRQWIRQVGDVPLAD